MGLVTQFVLLAATAQPPSAWVVSCQKAEAASSRWNTYKALAAAADIEWKNDQDHCQRLEQALKSATVIDLRNENIKDLEPVFAFEKVTQLLASNNQISSIAGIEAMKNLEILDLGNNAVKDVSPLPALKKLNQLRLAKNGIQNIKDLQTMTRLEKLSLAYNKVQDVAGLASLQNLNYLSLASNAIEKPEALKTLKKVQVLNLSFNQVCSAKDFEGYASKDIKIIGRDNQNCKDRPT